MKPREYKDIKQHIQNGRMPLRLDEGYLKTNFVRKTKSFLLKGEELFKRFKGQDLRVVQYKDLDSMWAEIHERTHCGREATWGNFRNQFWFKGAYQWIAKKIKKCDNCGQKRNFLAPKVMAPLRPIPTKPICWGRVHLDLTGGCLDVTGEKCTLIVAVDAFSKYVEAEAVVEANAYNVAAFIFKNIYARYGAPVKIVVDGEKMLSSGIVAQLNKHFDCNVSVTNARPEPNGQVEIYMRLFKEKLNAILLDHNYILPADWKVSILPWILFSMRCYPSSATKFAPASIMLGRKVKFPSGWPKNQQCNENLNVV